MTHYSVLTIGDAKLDAFLSISDTNGKCRINKDTNELCFKHGEKISVDHTNFSLGGNAANVVVGLTRLGITATIAAEIGDDEFALKINNILGREHIDRTFIHQMPHQESSLSVAINFQNDRTLFSEHAKREHNFHYDNATIDWIYLTSLGQEWTGAYTKALGYIKSTGSSLAFNPGTLQLEKKSQIIADVLAATTILFVNKEEAQLLVRDYGKDVAASSDISKILHQVQLLGPKTVVITDGKNGSYAFSQTDYHEDCYPSTVVERTGAGDAYATGFLAGTIHRTSVQEAMRWGSINAASVVGEIGAQAGLLTKEVMETKVHANL